MTAISRVLTVMVVALVCWMSAAGTALAESGPLGSDSKTSIIAAAIAGLFLGAAIAFWQSRKKRRDDGAPYGDADADPTDPGDRPPAP